MRILITALFFLSSLVVAYEVSIQQKGKFRLQVDGEIQEQKYTRYNDAVGAAVDEMRRCEECVIYIVSPRFLVEREEITTPPPIDPPIDPPPIDPPVVVPPPIDPEEIDAYYSLTLSDGELVDPMPLDGAVLPAVDVYVQWHGDGLDSVKSWCCKPPNGAHDWEDITKTGDLTSVMHLARHAGETKPLELYSDMILYGVKLWGDYKFFSLDDSVVAPPIVNPPVDEGKVIKFSWKAPTKRMDGSKLSGVSGYRIEVKMIGADAKPITRTITQTWTAVSKSELRLGTWEFRVKAVDNTPAKNCPTDKPVPDVCGGPLSSEFTAPLRMSIN